MQNVIDLQVPFICLLFFHFASPVEYLTTDQVAQWESVDSRRAIPVGGFVPHSSGYRPIINYII